jgi:uncharacterized repeat protein (TIGR01451 family)
MRAWKIGRTAGITAGLVVVALAGWAVSAEGPASPLIPVTPAPEQPTPIRESDHVPPLNVEDPEVQPAAARQPVVLPPGPATPAPGASAAPAARAVPDPPAPLVRIQVRVPADSAPGDDLKYVITVRNVSQADAHRVVVRNPLAEGVAAVVKADPPYDKEKSTDRQLMWLFGTLKPGQTKAIELVLKPKDTAKEVKNLAYVSFEHGEAVTTRINRPAVKVTKSAPKETVRGEPFTVRVVVENTGKVPVQKVRVVENVERSAELEAVTTGGSRTKPDENQWQWEVGTLMPGQRKVIEYRLTPRLAQDAFTTTNVSADKGVLEKAEARTLVHTPGLSVKLAGPTGVVAAGDTARYEITVRNTGTLPSTNVRVTGTLPADCKPTMKTEGGQVYRDSIVWAVPRLEPGEAKSFRLGIKAATTGRRVVVASATDARKVRASDEMATLFRGIAALVWETELEPVALAAGRRGTFTVRVRNNGGEQAQNVRLEVELPPEVGLKQSTPDVRPNGAKLVYGPSSLAAGTTATYTITYEAKQGGQAYFKARLTADALGDRPLETAKSVEITGGAK